MTREEIISKMKTAGFSVVIVNPVQNNAVNLYFDNDSNVCIYQSGKYVPGGRNKAETTKILSEGKIDDSINKIFIVYGHDEDSRNELELMLRRWGLEPIILSRELPKGRTLIEALEHYIDTVKYGIVLATPDDIGYKKDCEAQKKYRARQNVVFELGMLYAKLGRRNVSVLIKNTNDLEMEKPSDINGVIYIDYQNNVSEKMDVIKRSLKESGYTIKE